MRRPRCYIIGPFRAQTELGRRQNIAAAERTALNVAAVGYFYRCPHLHSAHFDGQLDDAYWLALGLDLLSECDVAYLVPDPACPEGMLLGRSWLDPTGGCVSTGSTAEVAWCYEHGIPVFYNEKQLRSFVDNWNCRDAGKLPENE
jgi:hypothetical protein